MIRFRTAANLPEAYLLRHLLAEAGIPARILNEHAQGGTGELPFTQTWPELWLEQEADLVRADEIVRRFERARELPPHACRQCGEQNPGSFELCWKCSAPLD